jgi:hypothetical protein
LKLSRPPGTQDSRAPLSPVAAASLVGLLVVFMAGMSAMLGWTPLRHIQETRLVAQWPIVQARISDGRVEARHQQAQGKHVAWDGWCARWGYTYDWQGTRHSGIVDDDTPSVFAPGCFAYEADARRALARRALDSTLPVRVDSTQPWHSTMQPASIPLDDVASLLFAFVPLGIAIWFVNLVLRGRHALRATPSGDPPAAP